MELFKNWFLLTVLTTAVLHTPMKRTKEQYCMCKHLQTTTRKAEMHRLASKDLLRKGHRNKDSLHLARLEWYNVTHTSEQQTEWLSATRRRSMWTRKVIFGKKSKHLNGICMFKSCGSTLVGIAHNVPGRNMSEQLNSLETFFNPSPLHRASHSPGRSATSGSWQLLWSLGAGQ